MQFLKTSILMKNCCRDPDVRKHVCLVQIPTNHHDLNCFVLFFFKCKWKLWCRIDLWTVNRDHMTARLSSYNASKNSSIWNKRSKLQKMTQKKSSARGKLAYLVLDILDPDCHRGFRYLLAILTEASKTQKWHSGQPSIIHLLEDFLSSHSEWWKTPKRFQSRLRS